MEPIFHYTSTKLTTENAVFASEVSRAFSITVSEAANALSHWILASKSSVTPIYSVFNLTNNSLTLLSTPPDNPDSIIQLYCLMRKGYPILPIRVSQLSVSDPKIIHRHGISRDSLPISTIESKPNTRPTKFLKRGYLDFYYKTPMRLKANPPSYKLIQSDGVLTLQETKTFTESL